MKWIQKNYDKWLHFLVGAMMASWLIPNIGFGLGFTGWLIILVIAFVYKELIYDLLMGRGTFEWLDVVYTMILPTAILITHYLI